MSYLKDSEITPLGKKNHIYMTYPIDPTEWKIIISLAMQRYVKTEDLLGINSKPAVNNEEYSFTIYNEFVIPQISKEGIA